MYVSRKQPKERRGKPSFPVGTLSNYLYYSNHAAISVSFPEKANGTGFSINEMEMIRMCLLWQAG